MESTKISPCCNCCQPFSIHGFSHPIRGRLPYLLQCGHSACEKCIITTVRTSGVMRCHQCQTDSDLSEADVKVLKENPESFQNFFPIHFYLLGVLIYNSSREPFRQQNSGINMTFIPAGASMRNKSHRTNYLPFNPESHQKGTKDYYKYLKSLTMCKEHPEKNLELYCSDCSKVICTLCLVKTCGKHSFTLIEEKNDEFLKDVQKNRQAVKDVLLRIRKTARELEKKHSMTSIGSVDAKSTETELAGHFCRAHGALQRVERLHAAELKANKNYFGNLISGLYDTACNLAELINAVDASLLPGNQEKVNLPEISRALARAADTPWYFEDDVKNKEPSIQLEIDERIFKSIESHCQVKVDNANLKLLATSELPTYVDIPPVPVDDDDAASVKSTASSHSSKHSKINSAPEPFKTLNFDLKQKNDVPQTGSAYNKGYMLNKSHQTNAVKKHEKFIKPLIAGAVEKVIVTHINNPHDFYIQRITMLSKLQEMSEMYHSMKNTLIEPKAENMVSGVVFLTFDAEHKRWDRVKKCQQDSCAGNDEYTVKYIDYGHSANIVLKRLRIAPKEPYYPVFSLQCSLVGCEPITGKWTNDDNLLMHKIIVRSNGECLLNVIRCSTDVLEVDLITCPSSPEEISTSIKDALIYLEHACLGDPKNQVNRQNPLDTKQYFSKQKLGDVEEVVVTNIIDPNAFYIRKKYLIQYFKNLSNDMNTTYNSSNSTGMIYTPKEGMCVACSVDNKWWRARVSKLMDKGSLEVFLVDSGAKHIVQWTCIRKLYAKFFKMDELISCCRLGEIKPVGDSWSAEVTKFMKSYLEKNSKCYIKLLTYSKKNKKREISLYKNDSVLLFLPSEDGDDICLNSELVKNGLACSTQQISKQVNVVKPQVSKVEAPKVSEPSGPLKLQVKVLSATSPSDVYISIKSDEDELRNLLKEMDKFYKNSQPDKSIVWKPGDKCAVLAFKDKKWNRAIIDSIDGESKKLKVFLKDCARMDDAEEENIRPLAQNFLKVRDGALKCHLSGISPASGDKWAMLTCEMLQDAVKQYDRFYITKDGEITNKSLPIELWVYHTTPGEALTPTVKEWKKINDMIVERGLAIPDRILKHKNPPKTAELNIGKVDPASSLVHQLENVNITDQASNFLNICDELTPPAIFDDWLPASALKSDEFRAMPTYVDENLTIYLYDIEQSTSTLELLSNTLTSHFKNSKPKAYDMFWYPGQICITKYELDERYYRARVNHITENNLASVTFVDYGNTQDCPISMLRKDIVLHHIPIQTHQCKLYDVKPVQGDTWEQKIGDFVHQSIVEKECLVSIMGQSKNGIIPIGLKVNKVHDLSELLFSFRYAVPEDITQSTFQDKPKTNDNDPDVIVDEETTDLPNFPDYSQDKVDWNKMMGAEGQKNE